MSRVYVVAKYVCQLSKRKASHSLDVVVCIMHDLGGGRKFKWSQKKGHERKKVYEKRPGRVA